MSNSNITMFRIWISNRILRDIEIFLMVKIPLILFIVLQNELKTKEWLWRKAQKMKGSLISHSLISLLANIYFTHVANTKLNSIVPNNCSFVDSMWWKHLCLFYESKNIYKTEKEMAIRLSLSVSHKFLVEKENKNYNSLRF